MAHALRTPQGHAHYARRKAIAEPVFGQMKTRQNAGRLRLRGLAGAQGEWLLHTLCHNLRKLRNVTTTGLAPAQHPAGRHSAGQEPTGPGLHDGAHGIPGRSGAVCVTEEPQPPNVPTGNNLPPPAPPRPATYQIPTHAPSARQSS